MHSFTSIFGLSNTIKEHPCPVLLSLPQMDVVFKIALDQNLIVSYHACNDDFKSYINFRKIQKGHESAF
jgi:hypothetical protein